MSAEKGHLEVCRLLLQCNADIEAKDVTYLPAPYYYYCLYEAKLCMRKLILLLFFSEATPLNYSAREGHLEVCRLLLQCNADIEAEDNR